MKGVIAETIYEYLEETLPEEEKERRRRRRKKKQKDQPLTNKVILEDCKKRNTNFDIDLDQLTESYVIVG